MVIIIFLSVLSGSTFVLFGGIFYDLYNLHAKFIYITNLYYKMNDLRRRQIEKVLDSDKNISAMVMNIEKKNVGLTTESLLPYTQLNAEVNESVSTAINQLFVLLERNKSEVHTYLQHTYAIVGMKKASVRELGNIEEVMRLYNTAVEPY